MQPATSLGLSRRRWPRIQVQGHLQAEIVDLDLPMVVRDVSRGGLAVESPIRFAYGEIHDLVIHMDNGDMAQIRARTVYCHDRRDRTQTFITGWEALGDPQTTAAMLRLVDFVVAAVDAEESSSSVAAPA